MLNWSDRNFGVIVARFRLWAAEVGDTLHSLPIQDIFQTSVKDPSVLLQMPASEFSLPEEDDLLRACRAALWRRTEADALDANAAFSELVSNGMLVIYYQRCCAVANALPFILTVPCLLSYNCTQQLATSSHVLKVVSRLAE